MKTIVLDNGLLLEPETEFEKDMLLKTFRSGVNHQAFIKTGLTLNDVLGLKVVPNETKKEEKIKNFKDWWELFESKNRKGSMTKKEIAEETWHAGQSAVGVMKVYDYGKAEPPEFDE